jgi:hypothetical protein
MCVCVCVCVCECIPITAHALANALGKTAVEGHLTSLETCPSGAPRTRLLSTHTCFATLLNTTYLYITYLHVRIYIVCHHFPNTFFFLSHPVSLSWRHLRYMYTLRYLVDNNISAHCMC